MVKEFLREPTVKKLMNPKKDDSTKLTIGRIRVISRKKLSLKNS